MAIDPAANKIYWTNQVGTTGVRVGNLDGSGTASTLFGGEANPIGLAIDPAANKIYWADLGSCCSGPGAIRVGNLDGSGTASTLFGGEGGPGRRRDRPHGEQDLLGQFRPRRDPGREPGWLGCGCGPVHGAGLCELPVLLRAPVGTEPPTISGEAKIGEELSCSEGHWAPDLLGAFLSRAPHAAQFEWLRNGAEISGETSANLTPTQPGSYSCRVTASNQAGSSSQTSDGVSVPPPDTEIDSGPSGRIGDSTPTFEFHSPEPGSTFRCKVDSNPYTACGSPKTTSELADGFHIFRVRSRDSFGNVDPTPASRRFVVDTTPPETTIDAGPHGTTNDPTPSFGFQSSEPGSSFECKIDSAPFVACSPPKTVSHLTDGTHTFSVRATDRVGNTNASPASSTFSVRTASISVQGTALVVAAAPGAQDNLKISRPSDAVVRVTDFPSGAYTGAGRDGGSGLRSKWRLRRQLPSSGITPGLPARVTSSDQNNKVANYTDHELAMATLGATPWKAARPATSSRGTGADVMRGDERKRSASRA